MAQPFIAEKGVIRLSPLEKAVASRNPAAGGNGASAQRATADPTISGSKQKLPEGVSEAQVAEAAAKAEQGDQAAIDWLKGLGIAAGVAGTGYAVHRILKGRNRKTGAAGLGADNIATDAASPNATTAVAKKTKPVDLYVDRSVQPREPAMKLLPAPSNTLPAQSEASLLSETKRIAQQQGIPTSGPQFQEFYEARRQRAAGQAAPNPGAQFTDFYEARRAKAAMKAIRRLP